jgi:hypothetical protein
MLAVLGTDCMGSCKSIWFSYCFLFFILLNQVKPNAIMKVKVLQLIVLIAHILFPDIVSIVHVTV